MAESAALLVSAQDGVQVGTEIMARFIEEQSIPKMFFINGMDKENVDFSKVVGSLKDFFGTSAVPIQIPIGSGGGFIHK